MGESKLALGFLADVLYIKGIICFEEFEAIQEVEDASDLAVIVDRMLRSDFNVHKRGEAYINYNRSI